MKNIITSKIFVIVWMVTSLSIYSCKPKPQNTGVFTYSFSDQPFITTESSAKTAMDLLELKELPKLTTTDQNQVYYSSPEDASVHFEQDLNTGNITYSKSMKEYYGATVPKLPSAQEAERICMEFLKKNRFIPDDNSNIKLVHQGGLRATGVIEGKKGGPVIDKMLTLTYGRYLDSIPVIGPGSKLVVNIGNNGEIMSVVKRIRVINASSKVQAKAEEIISMEQAMEQLKKNMITNFGEKATYEILSKQKAYYDGNGKTLQPVYVFETMVTLGDRKVRPFKYAALVNIVKNPAESVIPQIDPMAKKYIKQQVKPPVDEKPADKND